MRKLLAARSIPMAEEEYYCKGSFGPMHKGKPDADDLKRAVEFAQKVVGENE